MLFFDSYHLRETRFSGIKVIPERKAGVIEQKSKNRKKKKKKKRKRNEL